MKRFGFLYEQIVSVENCKEAILNASKHKRSRPFVQSILSDLDTKAEELSKRLIELNFLTPYTTRIITDGLSGKERVLQIPSFYPDQCAHHAIMQVLKPIITKSAYHWSCANMPKRGIDRACRGTERATMRDRKHAKYCVKMDISKFYPSIPHDKLKARLRTKIKDEKALRLIDTVIDSHSPGLPIGNYTSPWLAEFFLQPLDNLIKQEYKVKHYIRYADDLVLTGSNKKELRKAMYGIFDFMRGLGMNVKHDYQLFRVQDYCKEKKYRKGRRIDFVGRCFGKGFTTIRKRRALAVMRQSRRIQKLQKRKQPIPFKMASGFLSRSACFKNTDSYEMKRKYYDPVNIKGLKEVVRNESKRKHLTQCA